MADYPCHKKADARVAASPEELFAYLDDQARLGAHMEKRSMMMMGGRMTYSLDEAEGRAIGSVIRMGGGFLGIRLDIEEIVTERKPPYLKVWETMGHPRLLIMDGYRMGFNVTAADAGCELRVFIDYGPPAGLLGRFLCALFGGVYARWCVSRMAADATRHFGGRGEIAA